MSTAPRFDPGCDKVLLVQAELDGELDAAQAATLAAHQAQCPICQAAAAELARARALIGEGLYQTMPDDVRGRIMAQIAAALGMSPSSPLATRAIEGARRFGMARLSEAYRQVSQLDADFKNGKIKEREEALAGMLLELMSPQARA